MIYDNIMELVGNTPVVRLTVSNKYCEHEIFLKLEYFNPTCSVKDRAAINIIDEAERSGSLKPGGTIIEATSGNFGKALAMIGSKRGYRCIIVVDPKVSNSTCSFYHALGAEVEMVTHQDASGGYQQARIRRVTELLSTNPGSFWTNQYDNSNNPSMHASTTAFEILEDFDDLDTLVCAVSTGGHLSGIAKTLKKHMAGLGVVAVDAVGSSIFGFPFKQYLMNGVGLAWAPRNLDKMHVDWIHSVTDISAFSTCHLIAKTEGMLIGGSGGAVVFACVSDVINKRTPQKVLGMIPDTGSNYLDTIYNPNWLEERQVTLISSKKQLLEKAKNEERWNMDNLRGCVLNQEPSHPNHNKILAI